MHKTRLVKEQYAPRVLEAGQGAKCASEFPCCTAPSGGRRNLTQDLCLLAGWRTLLCMRSVVAFAWVVCCLALPIQAQRGGGGARGGGFGGGGFGGAHAAGGFHGSAAGISRPASGPAYRGYPPGARPSFASSRYGTASGLRAPGSVYSVNRAGRPRVLGASAARPAFRNRGVGAYRNGYGYGRGYGAGHRYPYRGYGYPFFPYVGAGSSPLFLPGYLGWDLDWDTLGWDSPGLNSSVSGDSGYDPGPSAPAYPQAPYAQPIYSGDDQAPQTADQPFSQPSPLLPEMGPAVTSPAREQVTTLIYKDGRPPERIRNYAMTRSAVFVTGETTREIPLDELDLPATERVNRQVGVTFQLP